MKLNKAIPLFILLLIASCLIACSSAGYIQTSIVNPDTGKVVGNSKAVLPTSVAGDQEFGEFALTMPDGTRVDIRNYKTVNPNEKLTGMVGTVTGLKIGAGVTKHLSSDHVRVVNSNNTAAVKTITEKGKAAAALKGTPDLNKPVFAAPAAAVE